MPPKRRPIVKADPPEGFCSPSMLRAHFARVSTQEGVLAPKYLTG